jgi:hypothetical protein
MRLQRSNTGTVNQVNNVTNGVSKGVTNSLSKGVTVNQNTQLYSAMPLSDIVSFGVTAYVTPENGSSAIIISSNITNIPFVLKELKKRSYIKTINFSIPYKHNGITFSVGTSKTRDGKIEKVLIKEQSLSSIKGIHIINQYASIGYIIIKFSNTIPKTHFAQTVTVNYLS